MKNKFLNIKIVNEEIRRIKRTSEKKLLRDNYNIIINNLHIVKFMNKEDREKFILTHITQKEAELILCRLYQSDNIKKQLINSLKKVVERYRKTRRLI